MDTMARGRPGKPGARSFLSLPRVCIWTFCCFPRHINRLERKQPRTGTKATACNTGIPYRCWFTFWLLHFQPAPCYDLEKAAEHGPSVFPQPPTGEIQMELLTLTWLSSGWRSHPGSEAADRRSLCLSPLSPLTLPFR